MEDFKYDRDNLKKALIRLLWCFGLYFGVAIIGNFFHDNKQMESVLGRIMLIFLLGMIFFKFVIVFKIKPVVERMKMSVILYQAAVLLLPIGDVLITLYVLNRANKYSESR